MTKVVLEEYDRELNAGRDRGQYRDKGKRTTTIKTVYGNVAYERHVYQTEDSKELIFNVRMTEIITTLSAAKEPKKDGKGNPYVDVINMHIPLRDAVQTAARRAFAKALL